MKKIYLLVILFAFIICFGTLLIASHMRKPKVISSNGRNKEVESLFHLPIPSPSDEHEDNYTGAIDDGFTAQEYYVGFTNLNTVYDILTLQALSDISSEAARYLNNHGFCDIHSLTVIEDSIISDRSYPYFLCRLENNSEICLEIRYDVESMRFLFDLISQ